MTRPSPASEPLKFPRAAYMPRVGALQAAIVAVAFTWLPSALFASAAGLSSFQSFLADYAVQSRLLIIIPVLILAEPGLAKRLMKIAQHFVDTGLVRKEDRSRFARLLTTIRGRSRSLRAQSLLVFLLYAAVLSALPYVESLKIPARWLYGQGGIAGLSLAGTWYLFVGLPLVFYLFLRWIWRQIAWVLFLRETTRLNLRLIPAHPDRRAGLSFVETCIRKYYPFSFALGTLVAGGVANRVIHQGQPIDHFKLYPLIPIALAVVICAAPPCVFFWTLIRAKTRGTYEYGALAASMGQRFEQRWISRGTNVTDEALDVQDFSATTDLYSIVANVHQMDTVPLGVKSISRLVAWTLVPAIPIVVAVLPMDVIAEKVVDMLF